MNVSVIIPVYNAVPFVQVAVESAMMQPEVIEILLIEDGSSDNSKEVCTALAEMYDRVKLLTHVHGKNLGAGASRNLGIIHAKGDFIAFLDADDYYVPNRFYHAKNIFSANHDVDGVYEKLGVVYTPSDRRKYFFENDQFVLQSRIFDNKILPENLFYNLITQGRYVINLDALVLRANPLVREILFDESLLMAQDTDYIWRLSRCAKLYPGNRCYAVSIRRIHPNNRIHDVEAKKKYRIMIFRKWFMMIRYESFDKTVNLHIMKRYVYILNEFHGLSFLPVKFSKLLIFLYVVLLKPWTIKKLI